MYKYKYYPTPYVVLHTLVLCTLSVLLTSVGHKAILAPRPNSPSKDRPVNTWLSLADHGSIGEMNDSQQGHNTGITKNAESRWANYREIKCHCASTL